MASKQTDSQKREVEHIHSQRLQIEMVLHYYTVLNSCGITASPLHCLAWRRRNKSWEKQMPSFLFIFLSDIWSSAKEQSRS